MAKTGYYNNETEKYTRRIPLNIAETWNTWCETYNSQYPDIHISKVDFASAAYLLFMKSSQKNIATSLKNISRSSKKTKQVAVQVFQTVAEKWDSFCDQYEKNEGYGKAEITAAAFDMLMKADENTTKEYINIIRKNYIKTKEMSARIAEDIALSWDIWCKEHLNIIPDLKISKGDLAAAALTKFIISTPKDTQRHINRVCKNKAETKEVKSIIPNYVEKFWRFWCCKHAFDLLQSDTTPVSKSEYFASAISMFMDSSQTDIKYYTLFMFSEDNYCKDQFHFRLTVDSPDELEALLSFAITGRI